MTTDDAARRGRRRPDLPAPEAFTSADGLTIRYRRWAPAGGDGGAGRPPVVLHHGFAADGVRNWVAPGVVAALVAAGRSVVAVDARGHGASDKPHDPARYGEATMAQDLRRLFDVLGADRVHLVGYSMGAIVALLAAAEDPRIERLAVGGVGAGVVELGGVDTRILDNRALAVALAAEPTDAEAGAGAGAAGPLAPMLAFVAASGGDRRALAAQAAAVHAEPIPLHRVTAPTLVLAGTDDPLAARPEALAAALPDARLVTLAGDHLAAVADPRFAPTLVAFLAT